MKNSHTKYQLKYQTSDEIIRKFLELVVKPEYKTRAEVNEVFRSIRVLVPDVQLRILSISKYTRVRELK